MPTANVGLHSCTLPLFNLSWLILGLCDPRGDPQPRGVRQRHGVQLHRRLLIRHRQGSRRGSSPLLTRRLQSLSKLGSPLLALLVSIPLVAPSMPSSAAHTFRQAFSKTLPSPLVQPPSAVPPVSLRYQQQSRS